MTFDIQTASDQGVDGSPRISILLANADSHFSEIEQSSGFKGAQLTAGFLFYDLRNDAPLTDVVVVFQGICNPPDQIKETTLRLTAGNRMNLQRLSLPPVRIQRRCPWDFPTTPDQRTEAVNGGANGKYSRYYRCGYSPDIPGGTGNLNSNGEPFTSCGYTRSDCQARGMWNRFGGIEFVPPAIAVRPYGKDWQTSAVVVNQARYNDYVPMVYGRAWYNPPVVFARNDGNLTRMEVLLGMGEIPGILKVLVNDVEIPLGVAGTNMTATGWYNIPTLGTRDGGFDLNFTDTSGQPAGDAYGSMAYLVVVVPNRISSGGASDTGFTVSGVFRDAADFARATSVPLWRPPGVQNYAKQAYETMASLMEAAGLIARLQFGEILWWFFDWYPNPDGSQHSAGMAFYDADTQGAFQAAYGRSLARFLTINDNPAINQSVDANFLQSRLAAYVQGIQAYVLARHPAALFELLWPLDVNLPETKRLNWYVNLPASWKQKNGSGFSFLRSCVKVFSLAASTATWMRFHVALRIRSANWRGPQVIAVT